MNDTPQGDGNKLELLVCIVHLVNLQYKNERYSARRRKLFTRFYNILISC